MPRGGFRESLEVLFLGAREVRSLVLHPALVRLEYLFWVYYLLKFLPFDIWLQGRPLKDRPFGDFRFGETPYGTAIEILREARLGPGETMIDLGCGRGKMVFTAALCFQARAIGVELLPTYCQLADKIRRRLRLERETEFVLEDFTFCDVYPADVIYVAGSIFAEETQAELLLLVDQLQPGSRWISVGWESRHPLLVLESTRERLFSWGYEQVYQYVVQDACDHPEIVPTHADPNELDSLAD